MLELGSDKMIRVGICDDSEAIVTKLSGIIKQYGRENEKEIKVVTFSSGLELLEKYSGDLDILFLDIKMPGIDGIKTAEKVRQRDTSVSIIFLTSLLQHSLDGYRVGAFNYLIKPITYKRLEMELNAWYQKYSQDEEPYIVLKNQEGIHKVLIKELSYIETSNRKVLIHTKGRTIACSKKLKELENELQEQGFCRCHSAYIVNLAYIEKIEQPDAQLITGEIIPISQSKRKHFMKSLARYWGEKI